LQPARHLRTEVVFIDAVRNTTDVLYGCVDYPAYRDPEGKELIFDSRWDLIEAGFFPEDSDLTLDQMKEALESPYMVGTPSSSYEYEQKSIKRVIVKI
jgi:hypothetical protein